MLQVEVRPHLTRLDSCPHQGVYGWGNLAVWLGRKGEGYLKRYFKGAVFKHTVFSKCQPSKQLGFERLSDPPSVCVLV